MADRNKQILSLFPKSQSWEENYKKIIELGKKLKPFDEKDKNENWLIKACQSPLWLKVEKKPSGNLIFTGDSPALITKGILALVIIFYTDRNPEEILKDKILFFEELQLNKYLSSKRTNGFYVLLNQILQYAKVFLIQNNLNK